MTLQIKLGRVYMRMMAVKKIWFPNRILSDKEIREIRSRLTEILVTLVQKSLVLLGGGGVVSLVVVGGGGGEFSVGGGGGCKGGGGGGGGGGVRSQCWVRGVFNGIYKNMFVLQFI